MDDPNQFVADEDDDFGNVRAACGLMLDSLGERFGVKAVAALWNASNRRLAESISAQQTGDSMWWRPREAALLAVGTMNEVVLSSLERAQEKGKPAPFDIAAFMKTVIENDLHESTAASAPFLSSSLTTASCPLAAAAASAVTPLASVSALARSTLRSSAACTAPQSPSFALL